MESSPNPTGRERRWLPWAIGGAALVVGGLIGGLIASATSSSSTSQAGACDATSVANKALPSVVTISARAPDGKSGGTGSGEVIRSDGYILTNNHVISVAANGGTVEVLFNDGKSTPATITGRDPKADLAVVKVSETDLPVIPFGSSKDVTVGEPVVALGAPLGLSDTVTSGIVSALDRTVEVPSDNDTTALLVSAVQTDAAINPGNSGGALVDCSAKLVGVPSAGALAPNTGPGGSSTGSIGLGFAIPVDLAKAISDEIIATGTVSHGYFGISVITLPESAAKDLGLSGGIFVQAVVPGGPSALAGLQAGDVITELNGEPAKSSDQLAALTITKRAGDVVPVSYLRNGQTATTKITVGTQP
jgi:putative serine protease PepD